jgi:thiamine kinase-like enzyme
MDDGSLSAEADGSQVPSAADSANTPGLLPEIVEKVTASLGPLSGEPKPLEGGITNRNFRARLGGREYVIRVPGKETSLLGIDRVAEMEANELAARLGIAPPVAIRLEDPACLVTEFVEGREMSAEQLREPAALRSVAVSLRSLHECAETVPARFDSFRLVSTYAETAAGRGAEVPPPFGEAAAAAARIEDVLGGPEHVPVPCHNDLLAANFLDDGERIRIVDWEYAGMGDRYFDLANFAVNNGLAGEQQGELLAAYFGEQPTAAQLATLRLMTFMSDFREAMWGVVQSAVSEIEFDFAEYADKHFERLSKTASDPGFATWLEEARDAPG